MPKQNLNYSFVSNVAGPTEKGKRVEFYDTVVSGLLLRVTFTGHKTFIYRYGSKGKRYTIGTFPDVSISDARSRAKDLKEEVRKGKDPQAEKVIKRNAPENIKVKGLAEVFKQKHLPSLKKTTRDDYTRRIENFIIPTLGKLEVNRVERYHVIELLEDIAEGDGKRDPAPIQSNRVRAILSSMYNFGINRGIAEYNPVLSVRPLGKEKRRKRVYEVAEVKKLWEQFELQNEPYGHVFKMLLICGQRAGETRMMRWDEIENGVWTIPAEKTKAGRKQKIPLPTMALDVLDDIRTLTGDNEYVFESSVNRNEPVAWLQKKASEVRKSSGIDDFRLHDLRRTAASYMAEMGVDRTVLGKVLNHKGLAGDDQVTAIYDRHEYIEEKKKALNKWNHLLSQIINGTSKVKVFKMGDAS